MAFVVDRMEADYAVCEKEDGTFKNIRRSSLPSDVEEGDVIVLTGEGIYVKDREETEKRRKRIKEQMDGLWE